MPTIFSHAIFASLVGRSYAPKPLPLLFWILTAACAMLPDVDAVGFAFGVRYGSMFGHRGFTHSILFALLIGAAVGTLFFRRRPQHLIRLQLVPYFTLVTLSHPLLDALTNGGLGVALFAPFSSARYFFPWRPIEVSPLGVGFFSERGVAVIASEIIWVWLPALLIYLVARNFSKARRQRKSVVNGV
jgi:inner membrane protein